MSTFRPDHGFSVASIFAAPRDVYTFDPEGFSGLYERRMEIHIPDPSASDRRQYDMPRRGHWQDCEGADDYRAGFDPIMNALWPVQLAYGRSIETASRLMNAHAGAAVLVTIDDEEYIALAGGGMDLSWHLAAAYVCCGCVPPVDILDRLSGSPFESSKAARGAIMRAWREGARHMARQAKRLTADARKVAAKHKAGR